MAFDCGIEIDASAAIALADHCQTADRSEQVGLLLGGPTRITEIAPLQNHATGRNAFRVAAQDVADEIALAQARGLTVVGRYHTHPNGSAQPSHADRLSLPKGWVEIIVQTRLIRGEQRVRRLYAYRGDNIPVPLSTPGQIA